MSERSTVFNTVQCGRALGVSAEFIRGEILEGRLKARVYRNGRKRAKYAIEAADFESYREKHWPQVARARD